MGGRVVQHVRSPHRTKALVTGLPLAGAFTIGLVTVAHDGRCSTPVIVTQDRSRVYPGRSAPPRPTLQRCVPTCLWPEQSGRRPEGTSPGLAWSHPVTQSASRPWPFFAGEEVCLIHVRSSSDWWYSKFVNCSKYLFVVFWYYTLSCYEIFHDNQCLKFGHNYFIGVMTW